MGRRVLHVGVDVDDNSFHIGAFCKETGEVFEMKTKPCSGHLIKKLEKLESQDFDVRVCYEASYIGFSLCRELNKKGFPTEIIASSMIPEVSSSRVKTDRVDALKLARYYSNDLLTPIHVPEEEDEHERDLIRGRSFLVDQRKSLKKHILSACRRNGLHYKLESKSKKAHHWTKAHENWLVDRVNQLESKTLKLHFEVLLRQLEKVNEGIEEYDQTIRELSETEKYKSRKDALNCFRGIDTLTAMTLITEIGDVRRFNHPRRLTSYCGLDVTEYSSGGKEKKFGITKMGNYRIRTAAIESCQRVDRPNVLSKRLRRHRQGQNMKVIDIADRCTKRLKKKSNRLLHAGKPRNKVKVACAREFLGFVWEAIHEAA